MRYIFDANIFIQAEHDFYDFEIVPGFWEFIDKKTQDKTIYSLINVFDELVYNRGQSKKKDAIEEWAIKASHSGLFMEIHPDAIQHVTVINDFIHQRFETHHADVFLEGADPYLIAQAKLDGSSVVTFEKISFNNVKILKGGKKPLDNAVKIPDICKCFEVRCINLFEALRELKPEFVLKNGKEWTELYNKANQIKKKS